MPRRKTEYAKAVADVDSKISEIDRHRCHYAIDGLRCSAFGTICDSATWHPNVRDPERRWLCSTHHRLRGDPLGSREALHDLIAHPPQPPGDWREKMLLQHGLGELQTAWRDMNDEEQRAVIAETIRSKAKTFVRKSVVPRPETRFAGTIHIDPAERTRQIEALYGTMSPEQRAEYDRGQVA